ncbi:hypothetical protein LTR29_005124 [Friedmanniomyces endolithicus]|nr:hypothetical protein LTR29_005124 [Friedmanniomyces endolithicus]
MSTAGLVPPGQYPPFATVTEDDHGAGIIIAAAMGIAFTSSVLVVRVFIRKYVNVGWQLDDTTLAISTVSLNLNLPWFLFRLIQSIKVLCWVQSSIVLAACADGLGKSLKLIPLQLQGRVQQLYYASNLLYLCAIDLSRISIVLFLRRLTAPSTYVRRFTEVLLVLISVSTSVFLLAAALQCGLSHPWVIVDQKCSGWYIKWAIQAIVASIIELAIFAAPVWLVWQLQKNLKVKLEIVIWFGSRLLVIIFTATRLRTFDQAGFATDPLLQEATYICLTQAELSYSIIDATIPAARTLVTDLITYYNSGGMGSAASTHGSRGNTYQMRTLKSKSSGRRESEHGYLGNAQNQRDNGDADSQELIIRKEAATQIGREEAY